MARTKPERNGVCFIVHGTNDTKDTYSVAFRCNISAEECYRKLLEGSPGLKGRIVVSKFDGGKHVATYEPTSDT